MLFRSSDNLNYAQRELELPPFHELDKIDGLGSVAMGADVRMDRTNSAVDPQWHTASGNGTAQNVDIEQPVERERTSESPRFLMENPLTGRSASLWSIPVPKPNRLLRVGSNDTWRRDASNHNEGDLKLPLYELC